MDIVLNCKSVNVSSAGYSSVAVEMEGINQTDIIDVVSIKDIINHFGMDKILDEIGADECMEHFDLVENTIEYQRNVTIGEILE